VPIDGGWDSRRGALVTVIGLIFGLASSASLARFLSSLLFGVAPTDPLTFAAVAVQPALVSLTPCYMPSRRAMLVDPMIALRYE
jgi:putative ABC transport system permease protein